MNDPVTFGKYCTRFLRRLAADATPWARDNIGFAGLMVLAPIAAVYLRDRKHELDWDLVRDTIWIYLAAFTLYAGFHAVRTVWRLDQKRAIEFDQTQAVHESQLRATTAAHTAALLTIEKLTNQPDFCGEVHTLSVLILDFVYGRSKTAPVLPGFPRLLIGSDSATTMREINEASAQQKAARKYEAETLGIYNYKYMRDVVTAIKDLELANIHAEVPDGFWRSPQNSDGIRAVGKALAELADRVPVPRNITKNIEKAESL